MRVLIAIVALGLFELRMARPAQVAFARAPASSAGAQQWVRARFLISCPVECLIVRSSVAGHALVTGVLAQAARYWCIATLGDRWNVRILVVPNAPLSSAGPYRWLRHPNYLAVAVEVLALPLVHTAWLTAGVFSLANAAMLRVRIRREDAALGRRP
jgi:methyltransferase